jgi:SP family myo-inositol transporter-like MFS transporter 13
MADAAAEPLISDTRDYPIDAQYYEHDGNVDVEEESALLSPGLFIWGLTICAGVSGLLFGYEYVDMSCGITDTPELFTAFALG